MSEVLATGFPARRYFFAAGCCLLLALLAGLWGIILVAFTSSGDDVSAFTRIRPLHVTFAVSWILVAALAGVHAFLPRAVAAKPYSGPLARMTFWLLVAAGMVSLVSYLMGHHSGREYLNFPLPAALLIFAAWGCFAVNFLRTALAGARRWPVYVWMWATGLVMFAYTFIEGHLYLLPWFAEAPVRDISVQWKSYGALTGSWNMFVYGLSMYLMERFAGAQTARSGRAFFFYWLGLTNLLFGWAHHTYMLPQSEWIRWMAFVISMTEWVILATLLWDWAQPFDRKVWQEQPQRRIPRAFLAATTIWIGLNLVLALLFSIPSLNWVTHGTQVTIAHAMGTTVGINTMILMAVGFHWLLGRVDTGAGMRKAIWAGMLVSNGALLCFWINLLVVGLVRGFGVTKEGWTFAEVQEHVVPLMVPAGVFAIVMFGGLILLLGCWLQLTSRAQSDGAEAVARVPVQEAG